MAKEACPYESWSAMNDEALCGQRPALADNERRHMSLAWRIWEISVARANNWGHASFRPGELARLVCGKDNQSSRDAVRRGMKTLVAMGRIAPMGNDGGSTQHCILVNRDLVWRGAGKGGRQHVCSEIGHIDSKDKPWTPGAAPKPAESDGWASNDAPTVAETAPRVIAPKPGAHNPYDDAPRFPKGASDNEPKRDGSTWDRGLFVG